MTSSFDPSSVPEDWDDTVESNIEIVVAKCELSMPPEVFIIWKSMDPQQVMVTKMMMMGAMSFGIGMVSQQLQGVIDKTLGEEGAGGS